MHQIEYKKAFSGWNEALPLGNGHFGGMGYLDREEGLIFTLNHYDVYYRRLPWYAHESGRAEPLERVGPLPSSEEIKRRALEAHADPRHPAHNNYNMIFQPELASAHGVLRDGLAMGIAGSLRLRPQAGLLDAGEFRTALEIENACVTFEARAELPQGSQQVRIRSIVGMETDVWITRVSQTRSGGIESLELSVPLGRLLPIDPKAGALDDDGVFYIENTFCAWGDPEGKSPPFRYVIAVKLVGACARLHGANGSERLSLRLVEEAHDYLVLVTVVPGETGSDAQGVARQTLNDAAARLNAIEKTHQDHWHGFFSKSKISLPDPILEILWYLHLYSLASCSGEGSKVTFPEACGLNGLWDIKSPIQWGSLWYWDVNIQQAYWPVFASNHLELAKPFHRGLLSWVEDARHLARIYHKMDGIAADYPHPTYMSIWAWCAQYFWWYYTHSLDRSFLKDTAYPLFKEILRFYEQYAAYDKDTGHLVIFPDVAPEQGPMTRNSMSTLSCLKFLLKMGIEANHVLGEDSKDRKTWESMLSKCPAYASDDSRQFGVHYKDSEWAEGLLFLAHSGILKPIYPIREISKRSPQEIRDRALGTLRYADALQAYGTHNIWPAAAAAVLGLGDEARRILYDRGISLQMNANGMISEETDRWFQSCLVNSSPVYNPPLMEGGSTIVATLNEMLLHSYDGLIEVFPAIPVGVPTSRFHEERFNPPHLHPAPSEKWEECSFEGLLAEGAFEISAWLTGGRTTAVRIKSLKGGTVRLVNPFSAGERVHILSGGREISSRIEDGVIIFSAVEGQTCELSIALPFSPCIQPAPRPVSPLVCKAFTRQRVFLGKDEHTDFYRGLDDATLDFHAGHLPQSRVAVYKFDFTDSKLKKDYFTALDWQWHICGKQGAAFIPIMAHSAYTRVAGRGWSDVKHLQYIDRGGPDDLRRDFIASREPGEFAVDLREGLYQVVLVSGDHADSIQTVVEVMGGTSWDSGVLKADCFSAGNILLNHSRDGRVSFRFHSRDDRRWNVCAMIINRI